MSRIIVLGSWAQSLVNFRGELLCEMVAAGHEVIACAPDASEEIKDTLSGFGVEYVHVPLARAGINPLRDIKTLIFLFLLFKKRKPDYFLGYTIKPVLYGSLAARLAHVPHIFSIITGLGYAFSQQRGLAKAVSCIAKKLYRKALKYNEKVFFQNQDDQQQFYDSKLIVALERSSIINGSGVNVDVFGYASPPRKCSYLLIARLLKDKGIHEYIAAAKSIKKKYPDITFFLAGWIDENPMAVSQNDLDDWVSTGVIEFLGFLKDVRPAIKNCSVYVLPSYREGTPRTVLEAMAMGRAIVTTSAPGCKETVEEGVNGFLVPPRDATALERALKRFVESPGLIGEMGLRSREIAEQKYDVRKVNKLLLGQMGLRT